MSIQEILNILPPDLPPLIIQGLHDPYHVQGSLRCIHAPLHTDLIRVLKTQTSREIHQDERMDGHVKKYIYGNAPLWQPSYFIATTGTTVMEKVREYIDSQKTEEHRRKYEKTGKYSKKTKRSR